ncbi:glycosyltransferase family 4 protein [Plantactinospora sp. KLBMP9567]|uniref:glycosyltransferase family 4 protein n=1 Tax=Plantactinospora sp. KLBMP9567 TaxID=3085900 RepID=UPI002981754A|nr:glycosyltransferase family 4 protein [Plantactinospora sp. KLBMP9567]MDW5327793.1 glycosyltransferase family 4 protein [Plantactinospora sp. KLBMP9567]
MLVDNGVNGDSRVQKQARSAADAGWEVILLGRSPTMAPQSWQLGRAQVRLLPMPEPLFRKRHQYRRAWLRWPLGYPPNGIAEHQAQQVAAWRADLRFRGAQLELAARAGRRRRAAELWLRLRLVLAALAGRWVWIRTKMHNRGLYGRRYRNPWDRAYTLFWQLTMGDRAWRRLEPGLWDYELAYGPVVDELAPDLIHANDFRMLGVGARAKTRAQAAGRPVKLVWDAHEFLPGIRPWQPHIRWLPAMRAHEREYAPYADAVVTVSDALADLLRAEHHLDEQPAVVLNAPAAEHAPDGADGGVPDLRHRCGIGPDVPLVVYSGSAAEQRGLRTMVDALPELPGVHTALVVNPDLQYVRKLVARAHRIGVADRVHVLPYVEHWQVVPFLSGADVGAIPIHHWPNHEIALITKFFEYAHARLPLVVSDVKTMAGTVRSTGQGEVFRARDVADYARAVRTVLADRERYRAAYDRPGLLEGWTWAAQAEILTGIYRRLLSGAPEPAGTPARPLTVAGRPDGLPVPAAQR